MFNEAPDSICGAKSTFLYIQSGPKVG